MLNKKHSIVKGLEKSFPHVHYHSFNDKTVFVCSLGEFAKDGRLSFPIHNEDINNRNPYDIINAIWEYITKYVL